MNILDEIKAYKKNSNPLQNRYVLYIANKDISLEDRWEVFVEAPDEWKNTLNFQYHFKVERKLKDSEISWYDDFNYEKRETVDTSDLVEAVLEKINPDDWVDGDWDLALLDELKEEILEANLKSFDYDW